MAARVDVYVDTSAFIAFADRSDTWHETFLRLFATPPALITSTLVVAEGHAWFLRRYDRSRALQFLAMIDAMSPLEIASVGKIEQAAASQLLRRIHDQDLTLTDAVGLHLTRVRKLHTCWSTNLHLGLTGARLVIQPH
ncbi:MAG TPA: PIN domain-containing protein [Casimicrobiaceae bacterium]